MSDCSLCRLETKVDRILELLEGQDNKLSNMDTKILPTRLQQGIQQNFPHENLRRWGCYFFALLRWAQEANGRVYTDYDIISIFDNAQKQMMPNPNGNGTQIPIITDTCFVNDPVRLLNFLAGKRIVSNVALWTNEANHPAPSEQIYIMREKQSSNLAHFVLIIGGVRWDSLSPVSPPRNPAGFRVLV